MSPDGTISQVQQAERLLKDGYPDKALRLLQKLEKSSPGTKGLSELIAVAQVCSAFAESLCLSMKNQRFPCNCSSVASGSNPFIDWYLVLQVNPEADDGAIKKQYRRLVLLLHPDKNGHKKAEEAFKLVSQAYMVLSDHNQRASFNQQRMHAMGTCSASPSPRGVPFTSCSPLSRPRRSSSPTRGSFSRQARDPSPARPQKTPEEEEEEENARMQYVRERARTRTVSFEKEWEERKEKWQRDLAQAREKAMARRQAWERKCRAMAANGSGSKEGTTTPTEEKKNTNGENEATKGGTENAPPNSEETERVNEEIESLEVNTGGNSSPQGEDSSASQAGEGLGNDELEKDKITRSACESDTSNGSETMVEGEVKNGVELDGEEVRNEQSQAEFSDDSDSKADLKVDDSYKRECTPENPIEEMKRDPGKSVTEEFTADFMEYTDKSGQQLNPLSSDGCDVMGQCEEEVGKGNEVRPDGVSGIFGGEADCKKECSTHEVDRRFKSNDESHIEAECRSKIQEGAEGHILESLGGSEQDALQKETKKVVEPTETPLNDNAIQERENKKVEVTTNVDRGSTGGLQDNRQPEGIDDMGTSFSRMSDNGTTLFSRKRLSTEKEGHFSNGRRGSGLRVHGSSLADGGREGLKQVFVAGQTVCNSIIGCCLNESAKNPVTMRAQGLTSGIQTSISKPSSSGKESLVNKSPTCRRFEEASDREKWSSPIPLDDEKNIGKTQASAAETKTRGQERILELRREIKEAMAERQAQEVRASGFQARRVAVSRARRESLLQGRKYDGSSSGTLPSDMKIRNCTTFPSTGSSDPEAGGRETVTTGKEDKTFQVESKTELVSESTRKGPFDDWNACILKSVEPVVKKTKETVRPVPTVNRKSVKPSKVSTGSASIRTMRTRTNKSIVDGSKVTSLDKSRLTEMPFVVPVKGNNNSTSVLPSQSPEIDVDVKPTEGIRASETVKPASTKKEGLEDLKVPLDVDGVEAKLEKEESRDRECGSLNWRNVLLKKLNGSLSLPSKGSWQVDLNFLRGSQQRHFKTKSETVSKGSAVDESVTRQNHNSKTVTSRLSPDSDPFQISPGNGTSVSFEQQQQDKDKIQDRRTADRPIHSVGQKDKGVDKTETKRESLVNSTLDQKVKPGQVLHNRRSPLETNDLSHAKVSDLNHSPGPNSPGSNTPGSNSRSRSKGFSSAARAAAEAMAAASTAKAKARRVLASRGLGEPTNQTPQPA